MNISLPTSLNLKDYKDNKAIVTIEPCYPGYGVTLGNALRRVLLSSIKGSAIVSFKVKGAQHEFSSLPYVKEDLVELMINLKKIRLKVFSDEPVILNLSVKGEQVVTAGDVEKNSAVEIANPKTVIATLTDKNAVLEMELVASRGTGYVTVEDRDKEKNDIGSIMLDALFSPVVQVGFEIESVRVGERTDYDRLTLKMETDGTINPEQALTEASEILMNHFEFIQSQLGNHVATSGKKHSKAAKEKDEAVTIAEVEAAETVKPVSQDKGKKKRGRPKKND